MYRKLECEPIHLIILQRIIEIIRLTFNSSTFHYFAKERGSLDVYDCWALKSHHCPLIARLKINSGNAQDVLGNKVNLLLLKKCTKLYMSPSFQKTFNKFAPQV